MSVLDEDWQTTRRTIRERSRFMFNNNLFSDVKFVVQSADDESQSKQVIPAHKFVLSISSPVFEAMFYGELAETRDSIELPDCEYESLLEMFRFMYSDEVNLSGSNVMGVLYLAKKYMVPSLADKCTEYLQDNLNPSNVFSILPHALKFEEEKLADRCWEVVDKQTDEAVKSDEFGTIERSLLEAVAVRDTLIIKEIELFKAVDLWATKECERQGLTADGAIKRRILGEEIFKGIRFPTMKQEDFASVVLDSKILITEEIVTMFKYFNSVSSCAVGLPEPRGSVFKDDFLRCCRFGWVSECVWTYHGSSHIINFSVDKDIVLHGVCLFGSESNAYSVDLDVTDSNSKLVLVSKTGRFSSELLQCKQFYFYGFKVLFDTKIVLKKNITYGIKALISGHPSLYGVSGVSSVQCSGVTFTFLNSGYSKSSTSVKYGQFPKLLFSL